MRSFFVHLLLVSLLVSGHSWADPTSEPVLVFAAISLTEALQENAAAYEKSPGNKVAFNFGASSVLARQIEEGAPADLFFSADEAKMDHLEKKGRLVPGTRRSLLSNVLVVVTTTESEIDLKSIRDLERPTIRYIALAEPSTVPAGIYAKQYLEKVGLWEKVTGKIVPTENVRAALAAVESGNCEAGIVYKTDAKISKRVRIAYEVPSEEGPRISYPIAIVSGTKQLVAARRFADYLASEPARQVFVAHGFGVLETGKP